jgi:hypothetical protein
MEFNKLESSKFTRQNSSEFTRIQSGSIGTTFITTNSRKTRILTRGSTDDWYDRFRHINKETLRYLVLELENIELETYDIDPNYKNYYLTHNKRQPSK